MKRLLLTAALVVAWAVPQVGAQQGQQGQTAPAATGQTSATTGDETEVTGIVTSADEQTREIVIDGETYVMPQEGGGAALWPADGDQVTLFYRDEGGQRVITRIGQPQQ